MNSEHETDRGYAQNSKGVVDDAVKLDVGGSIGGEGKESPSDRQRYIAALRLSPEQTSREAITSS
jgi:hypothetical protein